MGQQPKCMWTDKGQVSAMRVAQIQCFKMMFGCALCSLISSLIWLTIQQKQIKA